MSTFESQIIYNSDNTVSIPFGRVAEWYLLKHPLLKDTRLKSQSRLKIPRLIKEEIIELDRVEDAVDFLEWEDASSKQKSTNRIDDIIKPTTKGQEYIELIRTGIKKDKLCWSWIMYCAGDGKNCQHLCGGIGECLSSCPNYNLPNNLRNGNDMHRCSVRVNSFSRLSYLNTSHQLRIKIEGSHHPTNILNTGNQQVTRINLTRQIRDKIIVDRRADHLSTKNIKGKLLVSLNGAKKEELSEALSNNKEVCNNKKLKSFIVREDRRLKENTGPWTILHYLIEEVLKPKGYVLYYQQPDLSKPEDSAEHYYQLTVSDDFWLYNGRDFGQFCFGIDGKYDLNNDRAPILTMIVENNMGHGTPLAFDHLSTKNIKGKLLVSLNGAKKEELSEALSNNKEVCNNKKLKSFIVREDRRLKENTGPWTILHYLIEEVLKPKGYVLYYQQPDLSKPEDSAEHYYQLTVSDDFWLYNGRDFGQFCFGIDGKYDLNNDRAPILTMIVENNMGHGTPLAFAHWIPLIKRNILIVISSKSDISMTSLSNKENNWTIRLGVSAVKQNIPCNDLNCNHSWHYENFPNNKGFKRIRDCNNQIWNPYVMIDKHRPSKLGVEGLVRGTILCWFHIMQTFGNNLKEWNIPQPFRYPIALGFKLIARCRTEETAFEMASHYKNFINILPLTKEQKISISNDLTNNWMCNEWRLQFIDAGRLPDASNSNPMTTNNYTERMNRTIESRLSGKQTVVTFIERLYGLKLLRENLNERGTGQITYETGLVTLLMHNLLNNKMNLLK
ncbi:hypothetical protein Glove_14g63 [Diversispora epigaea]|uniref:Uncharacterized protein n=1 Tax=Diversispora epigaea TaxID=1348612 RepID=A0A397JM44_9GLOM|nr:hypothetical protein Glove_14g63 [Diversispora epigaea]